MLPKAATKVTWLPTTSIAVAGNVSVVKLGVATVIVPDNQLSLAIGKEGQNARLAARLTGWRVDIKGETQLAEEEAAGEGQEYAEGEWVLDPTTGEQLWVPADGGEAMSAEDWSAGAVAAGEAAAAALDGGGSAVAAAGSTATAAADVAAVDAPTGDGETSTTSAPS